MRLVKLFTADGRFVTRGRVPPFLEGHEAEALLWGDRVFLLMRDFTTDAIVLDADGAFSYGEVFAVALVQVEPGAEAGP